MTLTSILWTRQDRHDCLPTKTNALDRICLLPNGLDLKGLLAKQVWPHAKLGPPCIYMPIPCLPTTFLCCKDTCLLWAPCQAATTLLLYYLWDFMAGRTLWRRLPKLLWTSSYSGHLHIPKRTTTNLLLSLENHMSGLRQP